MAPAIDLAEWRRDREKRRRPGKLRREFVVADDGKGSVFRWRLLAVGRNGARRI
jgi:hypothetical protein